MLEEQGWKPQNVAGTSAGAITAAVIAAGYSSAEVRDITFGLDYRRFEDRTWQDRIPLMGKPLSVLVTNGIYKGDEFIRWMTDLLAAKGIRTFGDLRTNDEGCEVHLAPPGDRVRPQRPPAARSPARRRRPRPRAGRARRRPGRPDEHVDSDLLPAGPGHGQGRKRSRDRRRRDPLELPGLALRLPGRRGSAVADVRAPARRAGSEDPDRDADSET